MSPKSAILSVIPPIFETKLLALLRIEQFHVESFLLTRSTNQKNHCQKLVVMDTDYSGEIY